MCSVTEDFSRLKKTAVSFMLLAGDSVYSAACFRISFIFCGIQVFVNFPCGFIYSSFVIFFSESYQCGQLFCEYMKGKQSSYLSSCINRLFVARALDISFLE